MHIREACRALIGNSRALGNVDKAPCMYSRCIICCRMVCACFWFIAGWKLFVSSELQHRGHGMYRIGWYWDGWVDDKYTECRPLITSGRSASLARLMSREGGGDSHLIGAKHRHEALPKAVGCRNEVWGVMRELA